MNAYLPSSEGEAGDIQLRAAQWVVERASAAWSEEDRQNLDAWLAQSTAHEVAFWRAKHAWEKADRVVALKSPMQRGVERQPRAAGRSGLFRVAVGLCAAAIVGVIVFDMQSGPDYTTYSTPVGGRKILRLADGSHIELNTNTVLRLSRGNGARQAILDRGEAFFDIVHDAAHPFTIEARGRRIVDVGTKFLVRDAQERLQVSMLEGEVTLSAPKNSGDKPSRLTAGDVAVATATSTVITKEPKPAIADAASWRQGMLVFRHTTLADAVAEFNRYNDAQLVVAGERAGNMKIDGKFQTHDVDTFAEVAKDVLHLNVQKVGKKTVMSR
jgi:transmembrane sensor